MTQFWCAESRLHDGYVFISATLHFTCLPHVAREFNKGGFGVYLSE